MAFIGQAVATSILDRVVGVGWTAVQESLLPAAEIEAELERLQRTLPQIKAVLCAVESGEIDNQNEALTSWMWQFRDAVESAEDVLDEMAYYKLEEKIQKQNEEVGSSTSGLKRKLNSFANCMLKADNHGILKRLAKAVKGLDEVVSSVHNFLYLQKGSRRFSGKISEDKNVENDRETGSMITESVVFGRENERISIVEWLTDPSIGDVTLSAFTIYGIGGLGKTTLAQLISNDGRIRQFFDPIIWVCVSDQFDAVAILEKIIEFLSKKSPKVSSLTSLQDILKEKLRSKRFLLVLDDVWNDENKSQWEILVAPLKFGYGKILVTTRMESVANMAAKVIEGKMGHLKLGGLEEEKFFMLFKKHAFHGVNPDEFGNLIPIGKQIAEKLGGCPLAAKIMGGVLNYSIEFEYWKKVLKEDVPNFHVAKDGMMVVLRLSYCHLPTYLQLCFRYCSIFPKDYEFKKDELIKMWMGSGLIEPLCKRQMPVNVGREYFNCLVRKSFLDLKQYYFREDCYVMHDLLHDLAQSVSDGESLRIERNSQDIPGTIRHLSFNMESLLAISEISHLKNLRTLFIKFNGDNPDSDNIQIFSEVLKRLKSLRLLRIVTIARKGFFKIPDTIGELIHLRYLSHESSTYRLVEPPWFPVSVYKLYHLEVIRFLQGYWNIRGGFEVNGMHNLINLRHLDVGSKISSQIPFIGKLTFLPRLHERYNNGIIFPSSLSHLSVSECPNLTSLDGCLLEQHEVMQSLNKLFISNCEGLMYFPSWGFNDFTSLKDIDIRKCPMLVVVTFTQDILLPVSLQRLTIKQCGLDVLLRSVKNFNALTELILDGCPRLSSLPSFEILATLTTLNELDIGYCPELSSLCGLEALTSLRRLRIRNCDKLTDCSTSLSQPPISVNANNSNQLQLENFSVDRASLLLLEPLRSLRLTEKLYITDDSGLTCLPEEWLLQNHSALRWIFVSKATSLEHLPSCMDRLQMLEYLCICDAPLIQSLPDLPSSLSVLTITGCQQAIAQETAAVLEFARYRLIIIVYTSQP